MTDIRLEIKINGETITTAGVTKDSVFTQGLIYVPRRQEAGDESPQWDFDVRGLENRNGAEDLSTHLQWIYRQLTIGDEITLRILGPGESDPPIRYVSETVIEDPLLGRLVSGPGPHGCWNTRIPVAGTPYELQLHIPGASNGISFESRDFCAKIIQSLDQLIAQSLNRLSAMLPDPTSVEDLHALLVPHFSVEIEPTKDKNPVAFSLSLNFRKVTLGKDDSTRFHFDFRDWQIHEIDEGF